MNVSSVSEMDRCSYKKLSKADRPTRFNLSTFIKVLFCLHNLTINRVEKFESRKIKEDCERFITVKKNGLIIVTKKRQSCFRADDSFV